METTNAPIQLKSLGGAAAPPDLGDDLRSLLRMSPEAIAKFWQALGPCLSEVITQDTEKLLDMFCVGYGVDEGDLARAIKACRFLIQTASKLNSPSEVLAVDLEQLCPETPLVKEVLLAGYETAKAEIRKEIVKSALVDHGKVLIGAQWRVDMIDSSERGALLLTPVAMLTLHYREGNEKGRITLQALPDMIAELRDICAGILTSRGNEARTGEEIGR